MEKITAWIKEHPYATGAIVIVGGIIFLMMRGSSSAASGSGTNSYDAQIASIEAGAQVQGDAAQVQQNIASIQASAANAQVQGAVDTAQISANAQTVQAQSAIEGDVAKAGLESQVYQALISAGVTENAANDKLMNNLSIRQTGLAQSAMYAKDPQTAVNELSLVLNQGNIASYNQGNSASSIASSISMASILSGLFGAASNAGL